ncbi:MAG TPA: Hsp20/alpha crystallin family protein [Gemmataceae bacterium]|nr:Hsp20/alpha crystallin family protein [Gemmataceae bacterium]
MAGHLLRFMQSLLAPSAGMTGEGAWQPSADIYRTSHGWLVKFDLAGVRPEDVQLSVEDGRLVIRGMRRDRIIEEGCYCYHLEISYSHFERSLALPCDLEGADIVAEHREGMLLVRIHTEGGE